MSGVVQLGAPVGKEETLSARRAAVERVAAMPPSDKRAQTQELLLSAGRELIIDKGVGEASVGDVCSRAGFTRGAFYSNFTDMDHFVRRVAERQWTDLVESVRIVAVQPWPGETGRCLPRSASEFAIGIKVLSGRLMRALPLSRGFYLLQDELAAYAVRHPDHAQAQREGYARFKDAVAQALATGLAEIGRRPVLGPQDTTELVLATAERSIRIGLLSAQASEGDLTALLERTLPVLLARLSVPVEE